MPEQTEAAQTLLVEQTLATARLLIACAEPVKAYEFLTKTAPQPAIEHRRVKDFAATLAKQIDQAFSDEAYIERYTGYTNESQNPVEPFSDLGLLGLPRAKVALREVAQKAKSGPVSVLDIGAGDCTLERALLETFPTVSVSVSELLAVASKATQKLEELFPGRVGVTGRLDVAANVPQEHDVVLCLEVIEHVRYPELLLGNIRDALKPNGVAVVSTPNHLNWIEQRHNERFGPENWYHHLRAYTPRSLNEAFLDQGLAPTIILEPGGTLIAIAYAEHEVIDTLGRTFEVNSDEKFKSVLEHQRLDDVDLLPGDTVVTNYIAKFDLGRIVVFKGIVLEQKDA
jgi:2-polyprenyl-3-methyl-5-hydroxy-6-metoxy-1,4-benzoquinol methylase